MTSWPKGPFKWQEGDTMYISIPFTWNLPQVKDFCLNRDMFFSKIVVGGPATKLIPDYLAGIEGVTIGTRSVGVLQRINPMATKTTRGCPNKCGFCAVPKLEGEFVEYKDWPDLPILCDNNILRSSQGHFDKVCDRLEKHKFSDFNQGLDARLLTEYHAERIARLPGCIVRLALDHSGTKMLDEWESAYNTLISKGVPKSRMRSYVLVAFNSDPDDAWARCDFVERHGVLPLPQFYHPLDALGYNTVLDCHTKFGWTNRGVKHIMGYYYQHRGKKPEIVTL